MITEFDNKADQIFLQKFIDNYTVNNFDSIRFDWNGKHGDEFIDNNGVFRIQLSEFIINQINTVNLGLIRDLYIEWAKSAKEAFGVYNKLRFFAQEILTRVDEKFIIDYLKGTTYSMDTFLESSRINITTEQRERILSILKEKLRTETDKEIIALIKTVGLERFKN